MTSLNRPTRNRRKLEGTRTNARRLYDFRHATVCGLTDGAGRHSGTVIIRAQLRGTRATLFRRFPAELAAGAGTGPGASRADDVRPPAEAGRAASEGHS